MVRCLLLVLFVSLSACGGSGGGGAGASFGLTGRPGNTQCLAFAASGEVQLTALVPNLAFDAPLLMVPHPSQNTVVYVLEQAGTVYRVDLATETRSVLVNLADFYPISDPASCLECGLLGMAFDPAFADNGYLYLSFTQGPPSLTSYVARFQSSDNGQSLRGNGAGALERFDLMTQAQPYRNHNGGHIAFGPDNLLYIGLGDGGDANDPQNRAQDLSTRLGKMLRYTADGSPASNGVSGSVPEIYAYGLRNPWRWSFDRSTGALWAGDVGQDDFEEINIITRGGNYGWRCYEGFQRTANSCSASSGFEPPVHAYGRGDGISVTGGYVYRGGAIPPLRGAYLFSDFGSGTLWALTRRPDGSYQRRTLLETGRNVASFGQDNQGELYLVTTSGLFRIDPVVEEIELPQRLSDTGCVQANAPWQPADALIPYQPIEGFWSDGADKTRYLALPDNTTVGLTETGDFEFPRGSVLVKNFSLDQRPVETRLYLHNADGSWSGYSYRWDEAGSDAELVAGSQDVDLGGQVWHYPSAGECTQCHTRAAGFTLGLETLQLDAPFTYPQTGISANQLDTLAGIGVLERAPTPAQRSRRLSASTDLDASLEARARSYLHSNCSHCHRPGGTTQSSMDLRFTTTLGTTGTCGVAPSTEDPDRPGAQLLAPGDAANSLLYLRMLAGDSDRMPPISTLQVDQRGAQLVADWIDSLAGCN